MRPLFLPISVATAQHYQRGGGDAYGLAPEVHISDGVGVPCRYTLRLLPKGARYLIVAHRPFDGLNPYAETGPIFVSADAAEGASPSYEPPETMNAGQYIVRGYNREERILYGTGAVTPTGRVIQACQSLLERDDVAFVHIRSASNNCFTCRVERD